MTKRFFIWLFWYLIIGWFVQSVVSDAWFYVYAVVSLYGLFVWWGFFLKAKYKDRGNIEYGVLGLYAFLMTVALIGGIRAIFLNI